MADFKTIRDILSKKRWSIIFITFIVMFNLPGYFLANNLNSSDILLAWIVNLLLLCALSGVCSFLKGIVEKCYLVFLFIFTLIPNLTVFSYLCIANTHMYDDMFWVIFGSNVSETNEYFDGAISIPVLVGQILYTLASIFLLYKSLKAKSSFRLNLNPNLNKFVLMVSFLLLTGIVPFENTSKFVGSADFYKSGFNYLCESRNMRMEAQARKNVRMKISCNLNSKDHTFIVIIGESLSRNHMQLYGYSRPTTPNLESMKNELRVYNDVVSPYTHTIAVLKQALTFADHDHPEYYLQKPSVVDLFRDAGFKTYWISTQAMINKWGNSYGIIAKESDHVYDLSITKQHDEIVFPYIDKILEEDTEGNKIIFIHLMGSHNMYKSRYPSEYKFFNQDNYPVPDKPYLNNKKKKIIDEYDNSVLYSDFVISSIIKKAQKRKDRSSSVLFFSDHAEEVYDFRDVVGHFIRGTTTCQCEVPFILWCSENYLSEKQDLVIDEKRPFSTTNLIHSLSDLAGFEYPDYCPQKSLFHKKFVPQKRIVEGKTYEEVVGNTEAWKKEKK
ncbi:MAG: sulfatase-like hydrolase/transferase [Dysgonamonadaceae bacterium]|jgi:heptose-I-phosphate ethanolaminephosphotransferase|nr:sulfatase-like hydrolase/transferase [Dysgonamonadaceae bacterium]